MLDADYTEHLLRTKQDFVEPTGSSDSAHIRQFGAATVPASSWPGWPVDLGLAPGSEPVIETFVTGPGDPTATSDNQPFVARWTPLVQWLDRAVRTALSSLGVEVVDPAYVTASLTAAGELEGLPHLDDGSFSPAENVGVVAIIGEHVGPRMACESLAHARPAPGAHLEFDEQTRQDFSARRVVQCAAAGDQLVLFPQFGQLHAGPSVADLDESIATRQLLVFRARVSRRPATPR